MDVQIGLGDIPSWRQSRMMGLALKPILEALTTVNLLILTTHKVPPLYRSGVRYQMEPREWPREKFDAIPEVYARKWGDCDDLAPWRCAELRRDGKRAAIRVKWKRTPNGKLYHIIVVIRHKVVNPDGSVQHWIEEEDPSLVLGMPTGAG